MFCNFGTDQSIVNLCRSICHKPVRTTLKTGNHRFFMARLDERAGSPHLYSPVTIMLASLAGELRSLIIIIIIILVIITKRFVTCLIFGTREMKKLGKIKVSF